MPDEKKYRIPFVETEAQLSSEFIYPEDRTVEEHQAIVRKTKTSKGAEILIREEFPELLSKDLRIGALDSITQWLCEQYQDLAFELIQQMVLECNTDWIPTIRQLRFMVRNMLHLSVSAQNNFNLTALDKTKRQVYEGLPVAQELRQVAQENEKKWGLFKR